MFPYIGDKPLSPLIMTIHVVTPQSVVLLFNVKYYANKVIHKDAWTVEDIKCRQTEHIKVGSKHPNSIFLLGIK